MTDESYTSSESVNPTTPHPFHHTDDSPPPDENPAEHQARMERVKAASERPGDPALPCYGEGFELADEHHDQFDRICRDNPRPTRPLQGADLEVLRRFARLMPTLRLVSVDHDPNAAEFVWSHIRCILAAAGHANHAGLARTLADLYPLCPLDPDEDEAEWNKLLVDARNNCGWPTGIACLPWTSVFRMFEASKLEKGGVPAEAPRWLRAVAALHVLKHLRYDHDRNELVARHESRTAAGAVAMPRSPLHLATDSPTRAALLGVLGYAGGRTIDHVPSTALLGAVATLTPSDLLTVTSPPALPPDYLTATGANLRPTPVVEGFIRHGYQAAGVYRACPDGKVRPVSDSAVCSGVRLGGLNEKLEPLPIPASYDPTAWPSTLMCAAWPNLHPACHSEVFAAIFDALVLMPLCQGIPNADRERPIIVCEPKDPTVAGATKTGKSLAAHAIARVFAPGCPLLRALDTNSAADARAVAASLDMHGTTAIDEFLLPRSPAAMLCEQNLLALATGASVAVGKVYDNKGMALSLRYPLVVSSKLWDGKVDLLGRSFPILFGALTPAQRADGALYAQIVSGEWSLGVRLSALALIRDLKLEEMVRDAVGTLGSGSMRYNCHRTLAAVILSLRQNVDLNDAADLLDAEWEKLLEWAEDRVVAAHDSGLASAARSQGELRLTLPHIFDTLTPEQLTQVAQSSGGLLTPGRLFDLAMEALGWSSRSLASSIEDLCGQRIDGISRRTVAHALGRDARRRLPSVGGAWTLPGYHGVSGWQLTRKPDRDRFITMHLDITGHIVIASPIPAEVGHEQSA